MGPAAGPGHRLQLLHQLVGIVGERLELLLAQHDGAGVRGRVGADPAGFIFHIDHLRLGLDDELDIERYAAPAISTFGFWLTENPLAMTRTRYFPGRSEGNAYWPDIVRFCALLAAGTAQLHQRAGYQSARRIGDHAAQTRRLKAFAPPTKRRRPRETRLRLQYS